MGSTPLHPLALTCTRIPLNILICITSNNKKKRGEGELGGESERGGSERTVCESVWDLFIDK
jgi:hypothetical protein